MKIGIVGYGKLGAAAEKLILRNNAHVLYGIFTRRTENSVKTVSGKVFSLSKIEDYRDEIDVLLLCIGSMSDSFSIAPSLAKSFNTVDCFDTHARAKEYVSLMNKYALLGEHSSVCMCGWDPGLLSQIRTVFSSLSSLDNTYTYWGRGVSQGHSEAARSVLGVKYATAYTVPDEKSIPLAQLGTVFPKTGLHSRECYVVAEGDRTEIEEKIKNIPNYFKGTDTEVCFVNEEEYKMYHSKVFHRGRVIGADGTGLSLLFDVKIPSNPDFTAKIMLSYVKALSKLKEEKKYGARTPLDIPLSYLIEDIYAYV